MSFLDTVCVQVILRYLIISSADTRLCGCAGLLAGSCPGLQSVQHDIPALSGSFSHASTAPSEVAMLEIICPDQRGNVNAKIVPTPV